MSVLGGKFFPCIGSQKKTGSSWISNQPVLLWDYTAMFRRNNKITIRNYVAWTKGRFWCKISYIEKNCLLLCQIFGNCTIKLDNTKYTYPIMYVWILGTATWLANAGNSQGGQLIWCKPITDSALNTYYSSIYCNLVLCH